MLHSVRRIWSKFFSNVTGIVCDFEIPPIFLSIAVFPWIATIMTIDSRFDFKKAKMFFFIIKLLKIHKRWKYLSLDFWSDKKSYCISACVLFFSLCSVTPEPSLLWRLASNPTTPIWQVFISALCNSIYSSQFKHSVAIFKKTDTVPTPCNEIETVGNSRFLIETKRTEKKTIKKIGIWRETKKLWGEKRKLDFSPPVLLVKRKSTFRPLCYYWK